MHKICELCKKYPATVHLTDIKNNVKHEVHMCEHCAKAQGIDMKNGISLGDMFGALVKEKEASRAAHEQDTVCVNCGMTWREFRSHGRFGCAHDYVAFRELLTPLLEEIHTATDTHVGKHPIRDDARSSTRRRLAECQRRLRDAIEQERYEEAAALRDELASLQADTPQTGAI